jgi:hypothetical protein
VVPGLGSRGFSSDKLKLPEKVAFSDVVNIKGPSPFELCIFGSR